MWQLDCEEGWVPKNWCFWTVELEKSLESPLDCKEIKPVNSKVNQPWIFIGRADAEAEVPILWAPDAKRQLIRKDPDAGKDWGEEEKSMSSKLSPCLFNLYAEYIMRNAGLAETQAKIKIAGEI